MPHTEGSGEGLAKRSPTKHLHAFSAAHPEVTITWHTVTRHYQYQPEIWFMDVYGYS